MRKSPYLERIAAVGFSVDHVHQLFLHTLAHRVAGRPVVSRSCAILVHIKVLWVVDVFVCACLNAVDDLSRISALIPLFSLVFCAFVPAAPDLTI